MINNEIFVGMVSCGRCLEITLVQVQCTLKVNANEVDPNDKQ